MQLCSLHLYCRVWITEMPSDLPTQPSPVRSPVQSSASRLHDVRRPRLVTVSDRSFCTAGTPPTTEVSHPCSSFVVENLNYTYFGNVSGAALIGGDRAWGRFARERVN